MRILLILLSIVLLLPSVAACKKNKGPEKETIDNSVFEETLDPNSEEAIYQPADQDFEGKEFKILAETNWYYNYHYTYDDESLGYPETVINKAVYNRQELIYTLYGIDIVMAAEGAAYSKLNTSILAGDNAYDIATLTGPDSFSAARNGMVYDINKFDDILNLDASYYNQRIQEEYRLGDRLFQLDGAWAYVDKLRTYSVVYNTDLYEDYGYNATYGTPYDLVTDYKWTWETMYTMYKDLAQDKSGDGIVYGPEDQYGFICESDFAYPFMLASGLKTVQNVNGVPTITLTDASTKERILNIVQKLMPLVFEDAFLEYNRGGWLPGATTEEDYAQAGATMFAADKALFRMGGIGSVTRLLNTDVNYGMLPLPLWDENQKEYYTPVASSHHHPVVFPAYFEDDDIETRLEMFEIFAYHSMYMPGETLSVDEAFYENLAELRLSKTPEDAEMMKLIFTNTSYDLARAIGIANIWDVIWQCTWGQDLTSFVSKIENMLASDLYAFDFLNMAIEENCPN